MMLSAEKSETVAASAIAPNFASARHTFSALPGASQTQRSKPIVVRG